MGAAGMVYGYMVLSTVANVRIAEIETTHARAQAGVLAIMTPQNAPRVNPSAHAANDRVLMVLQNSEVHHDRQPVAVVIADTFERAKYAASLVRVRYAKAPTRTTFPQGEMYTPASVHDKPSDTLLGDAGTAFSQAAVRVDHLYTTPIEHHNPMEPHATIARWDGDRLTVYDAN